MSQAKSTTVGRSVAFRHEIRGNALTRSVALAGRPPTVDGRPPFGLPCWLIDSPTFPGSQHFNAQGQAYLAVPLFVFVRILLRFKIVG